MTTLRRPGEDRLPRRLHPGAWWLWALGLATAAARTTNPLLLLLIVGVAGLVVAARRTDSPWGRAFRFYLMLGAAIIAVRIVFRILVGGLYGERLLFTLPTVPLPDWAAGIVIGGPVTLESILAAAYDGLRLATLVICIGAANSLADPKRLLRIVPRALHDVGTAVVVAISFVPEVITSAARVRRARRLRGGQGRGLAAIRSIAIPVLEDGLDRSIMLAAAMDARGYGRLRPTSRGRHHATAVLMLGGLVGVCLGLYGLLDATTSSPLIGVPPLLVGGGLTAVGFVVAGRRIERTVYRPDPWLLPEWGVAAAGIAAAVATIAVGFTDPAVLHPSLQPLVWPVLPIVPAIGVLIAATPAAVAPPVRLAQPHPADAARPRVVTSDSL